MQVARKEKVLEARVQALEKDLLQMRKQFVREGHRHQNRFDRILLRCSGRMLRWFFEWWANLVSRSTDLFRRYYVIEASHNRRVMLRLIR